MLSRRTFVRTLGLGSATVLAAPAWVSARGREAGEPLLQRADAAIRLSSNENPNGPAAAALDAMRGAFGQAARYPGSAAAALQSALARHHAVPDDHILVGAGSGEILRMATLAGVGPGRPLVTAVPTFEDPIGYARTAGAEVIEVPVDRRLAIDLDALAARVSGGGFVFLCNPNNPTGTVHAAADVKAFVERVTSRSSATVLVDEAYHEYVEHPGYATAVPLALANPRVIVARTFSKVYGLAGVRVGYAVGRPEALQPLRRYRLGNAVNVLASAAAMASLGAAGHVERERARNREARDFTRRALEDAGYPCAATHTNFLMVDVRRDVRGVIDGCRARQVLIGRVFPPLTTHARISIGTMAEMTAAVDVLRGVLGRA